MTRPELTYCIHCGGCILPVDAAEETGRGWVCDLCWHEVCAREAREKRDEIRRERAELSGDQ